MDYRVSVFIKKEYSLDDIKIMEFLENIKKEFTNIKENYIFYENKTIEYYSPLAVNCYLKYHISKSDKIKIKNFLDKYDFIDKYTIVLDNKKRDENSELLIDCNQINRLVSSIDKLFFIRREFQEMSKFIDSSQKTKYENLLKELSYTKYALKNETLNLRVIDLNFELKKIGNNLREYGQLFGLDLKFNFIIKDLFLDKTLFSKIKSPLTDVIYNIILSEVDRKNMSLNYTNSSTYNIYIEMKQEFDTVKLSITADNYKLDFDEILDKLKNQNIIDDNSVYTKNEIYNLIFTKGFLGSSKNEEKKQQELALLNLYNTVLALNGIMYIKSDVNDVVTYIAKIPLKFVILNADIVKVKNAYFAIESRIIKEVSEFDEKNILYINDLMYYIQNGVELPVIKYNENANTALTIMVNNELYIFLVDSVLYKEQIYVRTLEIENDKYIGDCLLRDNKRAYVIDFNFLIKGVKNEK